MTPFNIQTMICLDEGSSGTAVEMDFIGHTDAVCCILVSDEIGRWH